MPSQHTSSEDVDNIANNITAEAQYKDEPSTNSGLVTLPPPGNTSAENILQKSIDSLDTPDLSITEYSQSLPNLLDFNTKEHISKGESEQDAEQIVKDAESKVESERLTQSFDGVLSLVDTDSVFIHGIDSAEEEDGFGSDLSIDKLVKVKNGNKGMKNYLKSMFSKKIKTAKKSRKTKNERAYKQF